MEYEIENREPVSVAVVRAVSAIENRTPKALRPLTEILDSDALDAVFDTPEGQTPRVGGRISFIYSNCRVTVESGEYLTLDLLDTQSRGTMREGQRDYPIESE